MNDGKMTTKMEVNRLRIIPLGQATRKMIGLVFHPVRRLVVELQEIDVRVFQMQDTYTLCVYATTAIPSSVFHGMKIPTLQTY